MALLLVAVQQVSTNYDENNFILQFINVKLKLHFWSLGDKYEWYKCKRLTTHCYIGISIVAYGEIFFKVIRYLDREYFKMTINV